MRAPARTNEWPRAWWAAAYLCVYLPYLGFVQEGELAHWLSLVILPFVGLGWLARRAEPGLRWREVARRLGLRWPERGRGLGLALVLVFALQGIQLMNRFQRAELGAVLAAGSALWLVPTAFVLALSTAAFTEEFFFRGILQRALSARTGSTAAGIAGASLAFALFHLPYAYGSPAWPSAGDLPHAIGLSLANGLAGGVLFGVVFARARSSLIPCMLVHAAVDWIPAIRLLGSLTG